jgi:hypothetical protein
MPGNAIQLLCSLQLLLQHLYKVTKSNIMSVAKNCG